MIEDDAKLVANVINSSTSYILVSGDFIQARGAFIYEISHFSIYFLKRSANAMTHEFVRASRFHESSFYWVDPLEYVVGLLVASYMHNN